MVVVAVGLVGGTGFQGGEVVAGMVDFQPIGFPTAVGEIVATGVGRDGEADSGLSAEYMDFK